jgi:cyclic pyranopterin phosphate synthase
MSQLSHFDDSGASRMVDVGDKPVTHRQARARGLVTMAPQTLNSILDRRIAKGDVFEVARLAGIMAAKRTFELVPLCHVLPLESVSLTFEPAGEGCLRIESKVSVHARTGVEIEALAAVSIAALTIYDMCKSIDRAMTLGPFELLEKSGGRTGHFVRPEPAGQAIPSRELETR